MKPANNVISKTLSVIRAFTDCQPRWGVNELAKYLQLPTTTVHRILQTLKEEDLLSVSPEDGKYVFGPELIRIASFISSKVDMKTLARPQMKRIYEAFEESVYLGLYYPQYKKMSFIDGIISPKPLKYVLEIGVLQPITVGASGKAILAFLDEKEREEVFRAENLAEEERSNILMELSKIREQGYAITANQRKMGALSIGAPIFDASRKVIGSMIYTVPLERFQKNKEQLIAQYVKEGVEQISKMLGYIP